MGTWATDICKHLAASLYNSSFTSSISLASVNLFDLSFSWGHGSTFSKSSPRVLVWGSISSLTLRNNILLEYHQEDEYTASVPVLLTLRPSSSWLPLRKWFSELSTLSWFCLHFGLEEVCLKTAGLTPSTACPYILLSCGSTDPHCPYTNLLISGPPQAPTLSLPGPAAQLKKYKFYNGILFAFAFFLPTLVPGKKGLDQKIGKSVF